MRMSSEVQQYSSSPPLPPDEGYWEALLQEGEIDAEGGGHLGKKIHFGTVLNLINPSRLAPLADHWPTGIKSNKFLIQTPL